MKLYSSIFVFLAPEMVTDLAYEGLFIIKNKPNWQKGRSNAIGGKRKPGETALQCAIRELREESGLVLEPHEPELVAQLIGQNQVFRVDFFRAYIDPVRYYDYKSLTAEKIFNTRLDNLEHVQTKAGEVLPVPNLMFLLQMARYMPRHCGWWYTINEGVSDTPGAVLPSLPTE